MPLCPPVAERRDPWQHVRAYAHTCARTHSPPNAALQMIWQLPALFIDWEKLPSWSYTLISMLALTRGLTVSGVFVFAGAALVGIERAQEDIYPHTAHRRKPSLAEFVRACATLCGKAH